MNLLPALFVISSFRPGEALFSFQARARLPKTRVLASVEKTLSPSVDVVTSGCADWSALFSALSSSQAFVQDYFRREPILLRQVAPWVSSCFGWAAMRSAVEADPSIALDAARVDFDFEARRGWTNIALSGGWAGVEHALEAGTVVFNSAGFSVASLAAACDAAMDAFELPVGVNVYLTRPATAQSAPPHTDRQDVIVVQVAGRKHWKIYAATPPSRLKDPFARGKGDDILDASELEVLLLDQTLDPGDMLYVPAGAIHQTATPRAEEDDDDGSCHLTFGIVAGSTWGLSYDTLRKLTMPESGDDEDIRQQPDLYRALHQPLPLGFLGPSNRIAREFAALAEANLGTSPDRTRLQGAIGRIKDHHDTLLTTMRRGYCYSNWREPYVDRIDLVMGDLANHIDSLYALRTPLTEKSTGLSPKANKSQPSNGIKRGFGVVPAAGEVKNGKRRSGQAGSRQGQKQRRRRR